MQSLMLDEVAKMNPYLVVDANNVDVGGLMGKSRVYVGITVLLPSCLRAVRVH